MSFGIRINLSENMYTKDPQDTDVGRRIIQNSIELIDDLGFEQFTFKKLALRINTTEASVYRYFENKHKLLVYLVSWYWEWIHYLIEIETFNINEPTRKLEIAIDNVINASMENKAIDYVNESLLHNIVIAEGSKVYLTKDVDHENNGGLFVSYKNLTNFVADIILQVRPDFPYARSLASNLFEMANNQIYFVSHLPRLTDLDKKSNSREELKKMLKFFAGKLLDVKF